MEKDIDTLTINENLSNLENIKEPKKELLKVKNLNMLFKVRGTFKKALDDINFSVDEGDFFGIIGESGSGKTTTGKTIIRLYNATGGTIEFDNQLISQKRLSRKKNKWMRKNIQMIFQDPMSSMDPIKNVMSIISEPLIINRIVQNETYQYMKKVWQVNNFFHYRFNEANTDNKLNFLYDYYTNVINIYNNGIQRVNSLDLNYFNTLESLVEYLGIYVDDVVSELKDNVELVYGLNDNQKQIINSTFVRYDENDLEEIDVLLDSVNKEIEECKKNIEFSSKQRELLSKVESIEFQLKEIINRHKILYKQEYKGIKAGLMKKTKSDLKTSYQQRCLSKDKIEYLYFLYQESFYKKKIKLLKVLFNFDYLNDKEISEIHSELNNILKEKYEKHFNEILKVQKEFEDDTVKRKATYYLKYIDEKKKELKKLYKKPVERDEDGKKIHKVDPIDQAVEKFTTKYLNISETREKQFNNKIKSKQDNINTLKEMMKNYGQSSANKEIWKRNLVNNEKKKLEIIAQRKDYITQYKGSLLEKNAEIQNLKSQISLLKKEAITNKNEFKKVLLNAMKKVSSHEIKNVENFKDKRNVYKNNSSIKNSILQKINTISSIEFELKQSLSRFNINTLLYNSNKITGLPLYFWIVKSLTKEKVFKALSDVGLKHEHAYRYPHEFSGGQRQRIVIARALITEPKLIIADEPISALDVSIQSQVINIMKKLAKEKGVTFLFIAHDLSMVSYVCNKLIIMHNGKIVEKGQVDLIFDNPIHPYTKSLFKAIPELSRIHVNLSSFDENLDYDKDYGPLNKPAFYKVDNNENHQVFGTESQVKLWLNNQKEMD